MSRIIKYYLVALLLSSLLLTGCTNHLGESTEAELTGTETMTVADPVRELSSANNQAFFREDKRIYDHDQNNQVINLYITILNTKKNKSHTFYDVNHWYDFHDISEASPKLEIIVQEGDETGPQSGFWGYGTDKANGTIQIRGASNRAAVQKSYKIKLYDHAGLWQGQTTLNLNKHSFDFLRIRNKLSFDYFKLLPDFSSLRTQFVHVYVQDLSSGTSTGKFEDYGLFTHIEQPNKRFLTSRGLDPHGQLYKATMFEFFRYPDELKLQSEAGFDKQLFEQVLEIKGSKDHRKLLNMLEAVNDLSLNINDVIDQYFDRDNYLTWLAVNILMGNTDTSSQNFFLYSPLHSEKFLFMPWDYDAAWGFTEEMDQFAKGYTAEWHKGISNYWGSVLHQRFIKDPDNISELNEKLEELLATVITRGQTQRFLDSYYPVVSPFVKAAPDLHFLPNHIENYETLYWSLVDIPEKNMELYQRHLEKPMPVFLGDPELTDGFYEFMWDESFDLQGDELTYAFQVSQAPDFSNVYIEKNDLVSTSVNISQNDLKTGTNYWRIIIKDSKGHTQEAFDRLEGEDNNYYNGIREFYVD